jgi:hypothetical protein
MTIGIGQKALYSLFALGAAGFAVYGVINTAKAVDEAAVPGSAAQTVISADAQGNLTPDGSFCNPYGCAGCSGCVQLQYQQTVEMLPSASSQAELY